MSDVQRETSPLPPGRYWIRLLGAQQVREFDRWVTDMAGAVRVEVSELDQGGGSGFVIFNVPEGRAPFLNAAQFGFPNFAPAGSVRTSQDVEQVPEPKGFLDDLGPGLPTLLLLVLVVALANDRAPAGRYRTA